MTDKEYYFLFSADNMPLGIFLTETPEESKKLFCTLYRRSWEDMEKVGIYMKREKDVSPEMWDKIHKKYKAERKENAELLPIKSTGFIERHCSSVELETEKYLRMQLRHGRPN